MCVMLILRFNSVLMRTDSYLVDVPYVWIFYPDLCEQTADVWFEQSLIAVTSSILCYSNLLMVFPI